MRPASRPATVYLRPGYADTFRRVASIVLFLGGCATDVSRVRTMAAEHLVCPADRIAVINVGNGAYRAEGCGRSEPYACEDGTCRHVFIHE